MVLKNSAVFLLSLLLSCVAMSGAARILEDTVPSKEEHQPEVPSLPKVELPPFLEVHLPPKPELPKVELPPVPEVHLPSKPEMPEMPKVELPTFPEVHLPSKPEMPKVELPPMPKMPTVPGIHFSEPEAKP
uniref:Periaxin n=1 Tax=Aegilops tauschii subsp. strangulata TaxID=200361 RepID=A0A453B5V0_AEGTS